jgi:acyl-CoA thioester hydrolase
MYKHQYQLRVRYRDVDAMSVVYYSRYLEYFEAARNEMMRDMGLPYGKFEEMGYAMPVVEAHCVYQKSAHFDDQLTILSRITELPQPCLKIQYEIFRTGELIPLVTGYTIHAFIKNNGRAVRPPKIFCEFLKNRLLPDE